MRDYPGAVADRRSACRPHPGGEQREEAAHVHRQRADAGEEVADQADIADAGNDRQHRSAQAALRSLAATRCGTSRTEASAAAWSSLIWRAGICFSAPSSPASWYSASSLTHQVS